MKDAQLVIDLLDYLVTYLLVLPDQIREFKTSGIERNRQFDAQTEYTASGRPRTVAHRETQYWVEDKHASKWNDGRKQQMKITIDLERLTAKKLTLEIPDGAELQVSFDDDTPAALEDLLKDPHVEQFTFVSALEPRPLDAPPERTLRYRKRQGNSH